MLAEVDAQPASQRRPGRLRPAISGVTERVELSEDAVRFGLSYHFGECRYVPPLREHWGKTFVMVTEIFVAILDPHGKWPCDRKFDAAADRPIVCGRATRPTGALGAQLPRCLASGEGRCDGAGHDALYGDLPNRGADRERGIDVLSASVDAWEADGIAAPPSSVSPVPLPDSCIASPRRS